MPYAVPYAQDQQVNRSRPTGIDGDRQRRGHRSARQDVRSARRSAEPTVLQPNPLCSRPAGIPSNVINLGVYLGARGVWPTPPNCHITQQLECDLHGAATGQSRLTSVRILGDPPVDLHECSTSVLLRKSRVSAMPALSRWRATLSPDRCRSSHHVKRLHVRPPRPEPTLTAYSLWSVLPI